MRYVLPFRHYAVTSHEAMMSEKGTLKVVKFDIVNALLNEMALFSSFFMNRIMSCIYVTSGFACSSNEVNHPSTCPRWKFDLVITVSAKVIASDGVMPSAGAMRTSKLTHWNRVMYICVGKLTVIGSDNGLSPCRRQAIIWTNTEILLIVRRAGLLLSQQDFEWLWSVPLSSASLY